MMMLNRLSRRGLSSSAAAFTTPHGLFAALTPTRRVLAVELWPVEGVVTCAVSDEYLGNSTTLEALGGSGGGGGKDVSRLLTDVFLQHDVGGVLLVRRCGRPRRAADEPRRNQRVARGRSTPRPLASAPPRPPCRSRRRARGACGCPT